MNVTREYLLSLLPADRDEWVVIKQDQVVRDIIRQLVEQYPFSAPMYDLIGECFDTGNIETTCDALYDFCVNNIQYRAEGIEWQSSSLPNGIVDKATGDCKAYASFIGGCLGAINRARGAGIDWAFRFVSYDNKIRTPYHVFIVVFTPQGEIWVDPTPGTAAERPLYPVTKKVDDTMALMQQIAGVSVDGTGQLVEQPGAVGAASSLNVPPTAIPLPGGYPSGIPTPYVTNGKIQFTPVPPNFDPTPEQVAWMMWALQVWVIQYGTQKYNVFEWRYHTDGTGSGIAGFVAQFCRQYSPATLQLLERQKLSMMFDHYVTFQQKMDLDSRIFVLRNIMDFDFGDPPPPFTPSALDQIMDTIAISVLKVASNLLPVIGPAYASIWLKEFTGSMAEGPAFTAQTTQQAQNIAQAAQVQAAAQVVDEKKKRMKQALIGAGIVLALWLAYDND